MCLGVLPPPASVSWLSAFPASSGIMPVASALQVPSVMCTVGANPVPISSSQVAGTAMGMQTSMPAGHHMGEWVLPIPDKLVRKILNL